MMIWLSLTRSDGPVMVNMATVKWMSRNVADDDTKGTVLHFGAHEYDCLVVGENMSNIIDRLARATL